MLFINPHYDLVNTLQFTNEFTKRLGIINPNVDIRKIAALIEWAKQDGLYPAGGASEASVFRKLASFMACFVAERPIINAFPAEKIGDSLYSISNHQNAIIALEIAIASLKDADIHRSDGTFPLTNEIKLSSHSYVDIVDALTGVTPASGMKMIAVLLEQMAYRYNPACEYQ